MIKYFAVENFRSIKEENIVEFDSGLSRDSYFVANPTIGIAGANASGKSSFLQALNFTIWFMQDSFLSQDEDKEIPIEPFISSQDSLSKLHLVFSQKILVDKETKDVNFEYILHLTKEEVIKEILLAYPYNRKRLVCERNHNKVKQGSKIAKLKSEIWINLRTNCSVVSFAAQFNSQTTAKQCKNFSFKSNLTHKGMVEYEFDSNMLSDLIESHDFTKDEIIRLLRIADLGIDNFEIIKKRQAEIQSIYDYIRKMLSSGIKKSRDQNNYRNSKSILSNIFNIGHDKTDKNYDILLLEHQIDDSSVSFDYTLESSGTLQFLNILYKVVIALKQGSTFIFDEIEIKLHQNLVAYIIGLFQNKYENPHGAQLIFSFHNTYFMEILEPSQLWFTQKNDRGYTEIFSAADFKDLKKLQQISLEELYRLGRFGAKPRGI